jgi:hypothetical protein
MNYKSLLSLLLIALSLNVFSQEQEKPKEQAKEESKFKISGKPIIKVFANYNSNLGGNESVEAFDALQIKRAYLGYKATLSENYSVKLVMDVGENSGLYRAYLKAASLNYKKGKIAYSVGMISTKQFKVQEKFWGYRYIRKSFQDQYKYGASADLGLSVDYRITKNILVDAIFVNGLGYKAVLPSGTYKGGLGLTLDFNSLIFRAYYDIRAKSYAQEQNIATFIGYKFKDKFRIGAEYNYRISNKFNPDHDLFGYSVYATYIINKKFEIFARYDNSQSNVVQKTVIGPDVPLTQWNIDRDGQTAMGGIQYKPIKRIKISANYRRVTSAVADIEGANWIFLNLEFKL